MNPENWLTLKRNVRFGDCDSAGVLHFHNLLRWAHESWEESLEVYGIKSEDIFPVSIFRKNNTIFPIINCEVKFFHPIKLGQLLTINLLPEKKNNFLFEIKTIFINDKVKLAECTILHCSVDSMSSKKAQLPEIIDLWIEASNIKNIIKEC